MRAALSCVLALLAAALLSAASLPPAALAVAAGSAHCAKPANSNQEPERTKPSSFAPHPGPRNLVYGAPIQPRILKSRPKKTPQLTSSPLPGA